MACRFSIRTLGKLDVFRMEDRKVGDLLEIIFLVKRQNFFDAIVFHDNAVNDVSDSRVVLQNALFDVEKELAEVVVLRWADIEYLDLQFEQSAFAYELALNLGDGRPIHLFGRNEDVDHFGERPHRRTELDILQIGEHGQSILDQFAFRLFGFVCGVVCNQNVAV